MNVLLFAVVVAIFGAPCLASKKFDRMSSMPGDKIACQLHGILGYFGMKHWMLATEYDHVIHVLKGGMVIEEAKYSVGRNLFRRDKCSNEGPGINGVKAVAIARESVWTQVPYSFWGCNSREYVQHWADGSPICSDNDNNSWSPLPFFRNRGGDIDKPLK